MTRFLTFPRILLVLGAAALVGLAAAALLGGLTLPPEHVHQHLVVPFIGLAIKDFRRFLGTMNPVAGGEKTRLDMQAGTRSYWLVFHARARATVAVAPLTAIRNRGSVFALFDKLGIEEDGPEQHSLDGAMAKFLTEMHLGSASTVSRLVSTAIGVTNLEEYAVLYFSHPLSLAPEEVLYREANAARKVQAFVLPAPNFNNRLADDTGSTFTVDQVSVTVTQYHDIRSVNVPRFIPSAREITEEITGANTKKKIELKFSNYVRAMAIKQEVQSTTKPGRVEVADIINRLTFRGEVLTFLDDIPWDELTNAQETEFSGLVVSNQSYLGLNFQKGGKLTNVLNPGDDIALRFEVDSQPSATPGTSRLRIAFLELERRLPGILTTPNPDPVVQAI